MAIYTKYTNIAEIAIISKEGDCILKSLNLDFIKKRRIELSISHEHMAKNFGFANSSTYWKYENGNYKFKAEQLPQLARYLNCKIVDFFN